MIVTLKIPDETFARYAEHSTSGQAGRPPKPETLMASQLERFQDVNPMDRSVIVGSKERSRLETLLSSGSLLDGVDLLKKVERLASLKIGGISIDFTPAEWDQLKRYADKNGKSLQEVVEWTVQNMKYQFFDHAPAGVA